MCTIWNLLQNPRRAARRRRADRRAGRRGIARPNLKFWIQKLCYEWCEFNQRCKISLSKIPLDQIFCRKTLMARLWTHLAPSSNSKPTSEEGFERARALVWNIPRVCTFSVWSCTKHLPLSHMTARPWIREVWVKTALISQWVVKFEKYQFSSRIFLSTPSMTLIQRAL